MRGPTALAQLNESDTLRFQLRTSLTDSYQQGNVALLTVRGRLDFSSRIHNDWAVKSQNSGLYQEFSRIKADNDVFSRNFLYYKPFRKVYPFAIGFVSANYRRKLDFRYFVGAGGTVQLIQRRHHALKASAGIVRESSHFLNSVYTLPVCNGNRIINVWRMTARAMGKHEVARTFRLFYDFYWQPALSNARNYRWQTDVGLEFPIWKGLAVNLLYLYTYENMVVETIKQQDQLLTFGVSFTKNIP
ncbi:DUF481 domain-containing protein [Runella slithyformis]|uniref:DUF481 domain-containing protein n=1 Tax=Runella slithyformis (strain ATCC 29530 / DSM 19594 / LMG 11500 / NCIMB 11436 / LSU 4) TaxID=761193 RepID=A0A7U3ZGC7_RUNSL|nr:DUF481 domain-containing protein [Runella slithyformis]AEI46718.1 hypothetical protein Runsl_0265 [Runella slithyformis DSM 19594]